MSVKITHLFHSGFILETANSTLVFDYFDYKNIVSSNPEGILSPKHFTGRSNIYVFVSHGHGDHFSNSIFEWEKSNKEIQYILSDDIHLKSLKSNYHLIKPYKYLEIDNIKIKTFGSTDRGVSFLVYVDNLSIFHSGDLNWWHWKNDSPQTQEREAEDYKSEINKLNNYLEEKIDIAFVPVDPRLEEFYYLAGEYFAKTIKPTLLIPMHFSTDYYITEKFKNKISDLNVRTSILSKPNEKIHYSK